jgi:circadian clock protein KaiB
LVKKIADGDDRANDGTGSWELRLYVAGDNINGKIALAQIKKICIAHLSKKCQIEVIDLRKRPEMALKEHVLALPMLVRTYPGPKIILVGDLTDEEKVLSTLEIKRAGSSHLRK